MSIFSGLVEKSYDKKIDSIGLSLFRICFNTVLFFEVLRLFYFKELIFDKIPFLEKSEISFGYALIFWLIVIFSLIIGFKTRIAAILNYAFLVVFIGSISSFEYHMFYAYMGLGFLHIFLPVSKSYSMDNLLEKIKYSNAKYTHRTDTNVGQIFYYLPVFVAIGLVYIDSIYFKSTSKFWMGGLGMWRPGALPHFNIYGQSLFLNNQTFTLALGYTTLVFEALFIFLFWFKKFRIPFVILGVGLHMGIFLYFPIPLFGLGYSSVYLLLIPVSYFKKLFDFFKTKKQSLLFIYDADCPLCNRTKIIISSVDVFNRIGFVTAQTVKGKYNHKTIQAVSDEELIENIYSMNEDGKIFKGVDTYIQVMLRMIYTFPIAIFLLIPGIYHFAKFVYGKVAENRERVPCNDENCVISFPPPSENSDEIKLLKNLTFKTIKIKLITFFFITVSIIQVIIILHSRYMHKKDSNTTASVLIRTVEVGLKPLKNLFGITAHPVYMDGHMNNYDHIFAVLYLNKSGTETWLPIIKSNGEPDWYLRGFNWVKWTFRVNSPILYQKQFENGMRDFIAFWAGKNNIDLRDAQFKIILKKIEVPNHYEKDFLMRQEGKPWQKFATIDWRDYQLTMNYSDTLGTGVHFK